MPRLRYRKKTEQVVAAVQIALDTPGFEYTKWGGVQRCKSGDYLVDDGHEVYTVNREIFGRTYRRVALGQHVKTTTVWARRADEAGAVPTKEGVTHYEPGDYLVCNDEAATDCYAVTPDVFEATYELDDGSDRDAQLS